MNKSYLRNGSNKGKLGFKKTNFQKIAFKIGLFK